MGDKGEKRKQDLTSDKAAKKAKFFSTNKGVTLPLGERGILVSCLPNKSKLAGQEAIRVLQPYYEELLPKAAADSGPKKDISTIIADEVADLKDPKKQLFKQHETGISSLVFISMAKDAPGPGPSQLVQAVAEDVQKTRQCKVRLCMRFSPIEAICPVDLEDIKKSAAEVVWPRFNAEGHATGLKFAVAYEHRASTGLDRLTVIKTVADGIKQPPHKADLTSPDLTILVQIVKDACAIGAASRFRELSKYNLRELCNPDAGKPDKAAPTEKSKPATTSDAKPEATESAVKEDGDKSKPESKDNTEKGKEVQE